MIPLRPQSCAQRDGGTSAKSSKKISPLVIQPWGGDEQSEVVTGDGTICVDLNHNVPGEMPQANKIGPKGIEVLVNALPSARSLDPTPPAFRR